MLNMIGKLDEQLALNKTRFIAGEKLTIADLLFFFEVTNLIYFDLTHDTFPAVRRWFEEVYQVEAVKTITHEWYQVAKKMRRNFRAVEVTRAKL